MWHFDAQNTDVNGFPAEHCKHTHRAHTRKQKPSVVSSPDIFGAGEKAVISAPGTLGTGEDSVVSAPRYPWY